MLAARRRGLDIKGGVKLQPADNNGNNCLSISKQQSVSLIKATALTPSNIYCTQWPLDLYVCLCVYGFLVVAAAESNPFCMQLNAGFTLLLLMYRHKKVQIVTIPPPCFPKLFTA